ncbi:MAG: aldehyde dehydrogenase family protein [Planctomycetaceae bacterium]|nr:aldehyde dehydrogenase family protein [Planctomycetaceae bacterium]
MRMFCEGEWVDRNQVVEVTNPFDGSVIDTVPAATADDVRWAINTLEAGARVMRQLTAFERSQILDKAATLVRQRADEIARTISSEEGKILAEAQIETQRGADVLQLSAEEARRLAGEMIPLEGVPAGAGKLGFTLRVPCGIVAAITPFNFPFNLVTHKVGPAIAGGNAVIIKPASDTPLSALKLVEILLEAGLPPSAIACITGSGQVLGQAICEDARIRKISFTGSYAVGDQICRMAGMKRVTMELGSNSPVIIMDDADLDLAAQAVTSAGYANAGQVCISAQRILTSNRIAGDFLDALKPRVDALTVGNPLDPETRMGPMVREADAQRVEQWVNNAVAGGARLVTGGKRTGTMYSPTIVDQVAPTMQISCEELFGPAVALTRFDNIHEAIAVANDSPYGLAAGIFTRDLERAMLFAKEVDSGNIHVNWSSQWRADFMPYGGLKHSGMGKEGPKYVLQEMTEEKMIVLHLRGADS